MGANRDVLTFVHDVVAERPSGPTVALTPRALDQLQSSSAPWVLDDLVDRESLLADNAAYIKWQLGWLDRFDEASGARGSARAAAVWITTPMDSLVMAARLLRAAVSAVAPAGIAYMGVEGVEPSDPLHAHHMQFWPLLGDPPLASRLLPLIAGTEGVPFHSYSVGAGGVARGQQPDLWWTRLIPVAARTRNTWRPTWRVRSSTTLMLWTAGHGARGFAAAERDGERAIAVLRHGDPTVVLVPSWRTFKPAGRPVSIRPLPPRETQADEAQLAPLLAEVDQWAQLPGAGALLVSRLLAFRNRIAPVIDRAADALVPQLRRANVDRLAATNPATLEEFAVLLAAQRHGGIRRILLQHGDNLMPFDSWFVTELQNFEEMWVSDITVPSDVERAGAHYSVPVPAMQLRSPRIAALKAKIRRRRSVLGNTPDAIGYVPAMLFGDSYAMGSGYFDDAWYHRWHLRLLERMASFEHLHFVWKALPASDQAIDPIPEVLRRSGITNVRYESRPFVKVVDQLSRVFFDFPSAALYEAVHLRLPVLAVVFPRFVSVRQSAVARFGAVVHECDDEHRALQLFEEFIKGPTTSYVVNPSRLLTNDLETPPFLQSQPIALTQSGNHSEVESQLIQGKEMT